MPLYHKEGFLDFLKITFMFFNQLSWFFFYFVPYNMKQLFGYEKEGKMAEKKLQIKLIKISQKIKLRNFIVRRVKKNNIFEKYKKKSKIYHLNLADRLKKHQLKIKDFFTNIFRNTAVNIKKD